VILLVSVNRKFGITVEMMIFMVFLSRKYGSRSIDIVSICEVC
jgi:hypothetical protein